MALDGDMQAAKLLLTTLFKDPPTPTVAVQVNSVTTKESNAAKSLRIIERIKAEREADPIGSEVRRRQALHHAGFAFDANPTPREILASVKSKGKE